MVKYTDLDLSRQKYILGLQYTALVLTKALSNSIINFTEDDLVKNINRMADDYVNNLKTSEIQEAIKEIDGKHDE